jgi:hypothetical protein
VAQKIPHLAFPIHRNPDRALPFEISDHLRHSDRGSSEVEQLIIRMASENRDWGYDRIAGGMANLGYVISDQTVGNVLRRTTRAGAHAHDPVVGLH